MTDEILIKILTVAITVQDSPRAGKAVHHLNLLIGEHLVQYPRNGRLMEIVGQDYHRYPEIAAWGMCFSLHQ